MKDDIYSRTRAKVAAIRTSSILFLTDQFRDIGVEQGDEVLVTVLKDKKRIIIEKVEAEK